MMKTLFSHIYDIITYKFYLISHTVKHYSQLQAFLKQRIIECAMESTDDFDVTSSKLLMTSQREIEEMLNHVDDVYEVVTNTKMTYLCRIIDSPKFVNYM